MNKTLVLVTLPSLLAACVVPNPMNAGASEETGHAAGSETGTSSPDDADDTAPRDTDDDDASDPEGGNDTDDTDPADDTTGDDATESGMVEPEPTCDLTTHQCVSNVPDGWNGPIAQLDAADPTGCAGDFSETGQRTYEQVLASAAECTCECGNPVGGACAETTVLDLYSEINAFGDIINDDACETITSGNIVLELGQITDYPSVVETFDVHVIGDMPPVVTPGSCGVTSETAEIDEPQIIGEKLACAPAEPLASCDEGALCVPQPSAPFDAGVCIWAEGDVECPAGTDFVNREVRGTGVVDTRSCTGCSCGLATGEACDDAIVRLWRTGGWIDRSVDGECHGAHAGPGNVWTGLTFDPGDPQGGSCAELGGIPQGNVEPETQITYCCT